MLHDESHLISWHGMYDSVKPMKNSIFLEKGKTVISMENMEFF